MAFGEQVVGPEGFTLTEVDRHIELTDRLMGRVFGVEAAPVRQAIEVVRAQGRVALGDIGCGTGNTLSSWRASVVEGAGCTADRVTGVGVTLADYSPYRDQTATAAWASPDLTYLLADITQGVPQIADGTLDSVLAYASVFYWKEPEAAFREIRRITKPGGQLLFNAFPLDVTVKRAENSRRQRVIDTMDSWRQEGVGVLQKRKEIRMNGEVSRQLFYKVIFPS